MRETVGARVAIVLARVVVPVWLLTGALLKLADGSPRHLPVALIQWLGPLGIDLGFVLKFSIVVELTVVGAMWLLPRLARPVGIAMLASFLPVLIGDVAMGASSCGCFGAVIDTLASVTIFLDLPIMFFAMIVMWAPSEVRYWKTLGNLLPGKWKERLRLIW